MSSIAQNIQARKHFQVGYSLYQSSQPREACQNNDQRRGWDSAQRGHLACVVVDTAFSLGRNASDADDALKVWF